MVVEFGTLERNMVRFLKQVLQEILLDYPDHVIQDVFSRIAPLTKLHLLHEGLKLFMRHFLLGKKSKNRVVIYSRCINNCYNSNLD
jgi:nucleolar MIF4G domain-containing protein 1